MVLTKISSPGDQSVRNSENVIHFGAKHPKHLIVGTTFKPNVGIDSLRTIDYTSGCIEIYLKFYPCTVRTMAPVLLSRFLDPVLGLFTGIFAYYLNENHPRTALSPDDKLMPLIRWRWERFQQTRQAKLHTTGSEG